MQILCCVKSRLLLLLQRLLLMVKDDDDTLVGKTNQRLFVVKYKHVAHQSAERWADQILPQCHDPDVSSPKRRLRVRNEAPQRTTRVLASAGQGFALICDLVNAAPPAVAARPEPRALKSRVAGTIAECIVHGSARNQGAALTASLEGKNT